MDTSIISLADSGLGSTIEFGIMAKLIGCLLFPVLGILCYRLSQSRALSSLLGDFDYLQGLLSFIIIFALTYLVSGNILFSKIILQRDNTIYNQYLGIYGPVHQTIQLSQIDKLIGENLVRKRTDRTVYKIATGPLWYLNWEAISDKFRRSNIKIVPYDLCPIAASFVPTWGQSTSTHVTDNGPD